MARYNPRQDKGYSRRSCFRETKQSFLIICEGVNTEPNYFNAFRLTSTSVKAVGKGLNTVKLVQEAFIIKEEEAEEDTRSTNTGWCLTKTTFLTMISMKLYDLLKAMAFMSLTAIRLLNIGSCCISISIGGISTGMTMSRCSAN